MCLKRPGSLIWYLIKILVYDVASKSSSHPTWTSIGSDVKITSYLKPFEHCTTIILFPSNITSQLLHQTVQYAPIISQKYNSNQGKLIENGFSLMRRRNPVPHCWASLAILPEEDDKFFFYKGHFHFRSAPDLISEYWSNQYFILVTKVKRKIQESLKSLGHVTIHQLRVREVIIIELFQCKNELISLTSRISWLRMYYHYIYFIDRPIAGVELSEPWYTINCSHEDCFTEIQLVAKNVAKRNKYFWGTHLILDTNWTSIHHLHTLINLTAIQSDRHGYQQVAHLTTFNGFVKFWILQDVLKYNLGQFYTPHNIAPIQKLTSSIYTKGFIFVPYDIQKFSYASCYQVMSSNLGGTLSSLTTPFDKATWICLMISHFTAILLLTSISEKLDFNEAFLVIGVSLENSVLSTYRPGKCILSLRMVIAVWAIITATMLSNIYKTCFTMEMILPTTYRTLLNSVMDVEGMKVLMPINLLDDNDFEKFNLGAYVRYKFFFDEILQRSLQVVVTQDGYKQLDAFIKLAKDLVNMIQPYFGIGADGKLFHNGTFSRLLQPHVAYNYSTLMECPIQPIKYTDTSSLKVLHTCGKVALMDTKENIAAVLPFLNDNPDNVKYLQIEDDSYFTVTRGWHIDSVRENYAVRQLHTMRSSGIFIHWETMLKLWKPAKLFHHYANWTHPESDAVSRLDLDSKILMAFYLCGMSVLISILVLILEIGWQKIRNSRTANE
ncbi:hypothetical protein Fcan01_24341 [Folsomia candida]|uniref:Uncharacterized protein n=1 Tax=Folsomia candida TaxID=158441 RepID=A0A226D681_FOLCA|nr:hypothetical protein Fcan01_24341 [Folsomia candida]